MVALQNIDSLGHRTLTQGANGIYNTIFGTPTFDTGVVYEGGPASMIIHAPTLEGVRQLISGSPTRGWLGLAFRTAALPTGNTVVLGNIHAVVGNEARLNLSTTGQLFVSVTGAANGPVISIDTWYWIEMIYSVIDTTHHVFWRVNSVDQPTLDAAGLTASTIDRAQLVSLDSGGTMDWRVGGWAVGSASSDTDFLGPSKFRAYSPSAVGTHAVDAATSAFFKKDIGGTETFLGNSGDTTSHQQIDDVPLDADSDHVLVRAGGGGGGGTQTDILPTAVEASSGYTSIPIGNIDEDPDTPDASWGTASGNNVATSVRVSFPTPTGSPDTTGTLVVAAYVRKGPSGSAGTGTPTARIDLYYNGSLISSGSEQNVTGTGQKITQNFDLATVNGSGQLGDGSGLEILVNGTQSGGSPSVRAAVEVGAIDIQSLPYAGSVTQPTNTWYLEYAFADSGETSAPLGVLATVVLSQDAAANCSITAKLREGTNEENIYSGDINSTAKLYKSLYFTQRPNAGGAWTDAAFDALVLRWGYTSDADGTPRLAAAMVQAIFAVSTGSSTPQAISVGLTLGASIAMQLVRQKALSVGLTMTCAISKTKIAPRTISSGLALNPTIAKPAIHYRAMSLGVTLTPTLTKAKSMGKSISVGVTLTPNITIGKSYSRSIAASVTFGATISKKQIAYRTLAVNASMASALSRQLIEYRLLSLTLTATPTIQRLKIHPQAVAVSLMLNPTVAHPAIHPRSLSVSLTAASTVSKAKGATRDLLVSMPLASALAKQVFQGRVLAVNLVMSSTFSKQRTGYRTLAVMMPMISSISPQIRHFKLLATGAVLSPSILKGYQKLLSASLPLSVALSSVSTRYKSLPADLILTPTIDVLSTNLIALDAALLLDPSVQVDFTRTRLLAVDLTMGVLIFVSPTAGFVQFADGMLLGVKNISSPLVGSAETPANLLGAEQPGTPITSS